MLSGLEQILRVSSQTILKAILNNKPTQTPLSQSTTLSQISMTKGDASRIQSSQATGGNNVGANSFASRAQSAGNHNANAGGGGGVKASGGGSGHQTAGGNINGGNGGNGSGAKK